MWHGETLKSRTPRMRGDVKQDGLVPRAAGGLLDNRSVPHPNADNPLEIHA